MKRLLGLIGLTYLSVLTAVFYFYSDILISVLVVGAAICAVIGIVLKLRKSRGDLKNTLIVIGAVVLFSCFSFVLYTNYFYNRVTEQYSDNEIKISGYVCDEVQKNEASCIYYIETETINGKADKQKIQLSSYTDLHIEAFDCVNANLHTYKATNDSLKSKGVFLTAYTSDDFRIEKTDEKHNSLYSFAVSARLAMKSSLDSLLPDDYSSLCKAVLLGDKRALSYDIRSSFSQTGASFLIVVSGLHLSVIASFILFLLSKITKNRLVLCISVCITVISFMAITGFTSSVVRSGVMLIMAHCAAVVFRNSDPLNSIGAAALVLTIFNPYAVGDLGLILSFAATIGIVMWAGKIYNFIISRFKFKNRLLKSVINLISVSLAASLWVIPVATVAFGTISPFVVLTSLLAESAVSVLIICALLSSVLYLLPFVSFLAYPFALVCGLLSKYVIWIVGVFAAIPYSSVNTDKLYFYIWLGITIFLVSVGYIIRAKSFYVKCATTFSIVTLMLGWAIYSLVSENTVTMNIYSVGSGISASIECSNNISLISCGGAGANAEDIIGEIERSHIDIDYIIIPSQKNKYARYQSQLINEFDVSNVLVYDKDSNNQKILTEYDGQSRNTFADNVHFTLDFSFGVTDDVINIDGATYQFVKTEQSSLLFIPDNGDIGNLPEIYRSADYVLIDKMPDNYELLKCCTIIFSGSKEQYNEQYNSLKEISDNIMTTADENINITL